AFLQPCREEPDEGPRLFFELVLVDSRRLSSLGELVHPFGEDRGLVLAKNSGQSTPGIGHGSPPERALGRAAYSETGLPHLTCALRGLQGLPSNLRPPRLAAPSRAWTVERVVLSLDRPALDRSRGSSYLDPARLSTSDAEDGHDDERLPGVRLRQPRRGTT